MYLEAEPLGRQWSIDALSVPEKPFSVAHLHLKQTTSVAQVLPFWFLCEFGSWFCREIFVGWLCLCNEPFKINKNRCENVWISVLTCKVTTFFTFISNRLVGRIFWNELHLLLLHVLRQLILQEMVWLSHCYNRVCGFSMFMSRTGWYRLSVEWWRISLYV